MRFKTFGLTIFLLFFPGFSFSQSVQLFDGTIDKYPIRIFLSIDKEDIRGYYIYKKYGQPIQLDGSIKNGNFELTETNRIDGEYGSIFKWKYGQAEGDGTWNSKSNALPIHLKKVELSLNWERFKNKVELTHEYSNGETAKYPIEVNLVYPVINDKESFSNQILSKIFGVDPKVKRYNIWEYFNESLSNSFIEYLKNFSPEEYPHFENSTNGIIVFINDSILSYKNSGVYNNGGSHSCGFEYYFVFDLKNECLLTLDSLFDNNMKDKVAQLIYEKDKKVHDLSNIRERMREFYLTDKGVGFVYNPYDLDCYVCGFFEYFINFEEIKKLKN
jgi:hypothetical protein